MRPFSALFAALLALFAAVAVAQERGVPTWAKGGVLHVELGDIQAKNGLPDDVANGKGHSAYPDGAVQNGYTLNLYAGTLIHTGGASSATGVYAWHNKPWSYAATAALSTLPVPTATPGSAILLQTKTKSPPGSDGVNDTWVRYAFGTEGAWQPQRATHVHVMLMGVNMTDDKAGQEIGDVKVFQLDPASGAVTITKTTLKVSENIRNFIQDPSFCPGCTTDVMVNGKWKATPVQQVLTRTDTGHALWSGPCSGGGGTTCYADKLTIELGHEGLQKPVIGIEVRAYLKHTLLKGKTDGVTDVYHSLRLHGITLERDFELQKNGAGVDNLNQASAPWGTERYGGREIGGIRYGRKKTLQVYGCAMTGAVNAGNYLAGVSKTPGDLNDYLRGAGGYVEARPVATIVAYTAQLGQRCSTFMAAQGLAAASTWCSASLGSESANAAAKMCCKLAVATAAGATGLSAGGLVELQSNGCNVATNACAESQLFGPYLYGSDDPAVLGDSGPLAQVVLQGTGGVHVFSATACHLLDHPQFSDVRVQDANGAPCRNGLYLGSVQDALGAVDVGDGVGFYTLVDWDAVADFFTATGTAMSYRVPTATEAVSGDAVEALLASGLPVMLSVRTGAHPHFVTATGYRPLYFVQSSTSGLQATGIHTTSAKEMIGTYRISDPGWSAHDDLVDATWNSGYGASVDDYANSFMTWRVFEPAVAQASLSVRLLSPAELVVANASGQRIGRLGADTPLLDTLPGASYAPAQISAANDVSSSAPPVNPESGGKEVRVPGASGSYDVAVVGTGFGPFTLRVAVRKPAAKTVHLAAHDSVWPGRVLTYRVDTAKATLAALVASDADADGVVDIADCATLDKAAFLGAKEACSDLKDNDCDGLKDGADPQCAPGAPACKDADGDGFADCSVPGCVASGPCGDCDDLEAAVKPGAVEAAAALATCSDGRDNDCDGAADLAEASCAASAIAPPGWGSGAGGGTDAGGADAGGADASGADAGGADIGAGDAAGTEVGASDDLGAEIGGGDEGAGEVGGGDVGAGDVGGLDVGGGDAPSADALGAGDSATGVATSTAAVQNRDSGCSAGARPGAKGNGLGGLWVVLVLGLVVRARRWRQVAP